MDTPTGSAQDNRKEKKQEALPTQFAYRRNFTLGLSFLALSCVGESSGLAHSYQTFLVRMISRAMIRAPALQAHANIRMRGFSSMLGRAAKESKGSNFKKWASLGAGATGLAFLLAKKNSKKTERHATQCEGYDQPFRAMGC